MSASSAQVELYWIPLGAGARVVRISGRGYEALMARAQRRPRRDLYHSALIVSQGSVRTFIEMAPTPDANGPTTRGVVAQGPVGLRQLGRLRLFRYEVRRWSDGEIPDLVHAIDSPVLISDDPIATNAVLTLLPSVPTPVWGRDELGAGEMWNSNSVVSWVLTRTGLLAAAGAPPHNGRAPGWDAGVVAAQRMAVR
jgi:hypothetical protein